MPVLQVESGPAAGSRFPIYKEIITIGRLENNDVCLEDPLISKHHARVISRGDAYLIEDLGSSNGTIVNGQKVSAHVLSDGEVIYLGNTTLTFWSGAEVVEKVAGVPGSASSNRKILAVILSIVAVFIVIGVAVLLIFVFGTEKDEIKPAVRVISPPDNFNVDLKLPVNSMTEVPIKISASDDKGLDRIVIFVNEAEKETVKATTSSKESGGGGERNSEEFDSSWASIKRGTI